MSKFKIGDKVRVCVGCYVGIPKGTILSVVADCTLGAYWIAGGYAEVGTVNVYHCEFELVGEPEVQTSNKSPSLVQKTTPKNDDSSDQVGYCVSGNNAWFERGELPQVGADVEFQGYQAGLLEWKQAFVVGHDGRIVVLNYQGNYLGVHVDELRPIKAAEEIEAEEREKAITEMVALSPLLDKGWSRRVCASVYDAGYRKMEKDK